MRDAWREFADFLARERGQEVRVLDLKKAVDRFFQDKAARKIVESGGDPLFESIFEDANEDGE